MQTFRNTAAQGDLMLFRVDTIPSDLERAEPPADGQHVLAHSESGHHHVMASRAVGLYPGDDLSMYLDVREPTPLEHVKSGPDCHEPLMVPPGKYLVRRGREFTPAGFRRIED